MIDQATIEHIKNIANIVDVVGDYVSLHRSGANYRGLCPFHNERTPSFMVSPVKNFCHCFGCGRGGDPIRFLMDLNNFSYRDALLHLANKYHIEVKEVNVSDEQRAERLKRQAYLTLTDFAAQHFKNALENKSEGASQALRLLNDNGISQATIARFGIGYTGESHKSLADAIADGGFSLSHATDLGLVAPINGEMADVITNSIVIPLYSKTGKVLAFSYQKVDDSFVTFKNVSAHSAIFTPKDAIFAYFQANNQIAKEKSCYFVPTPYEALMMHQSGFANTVSPLGDTIQQYTANDFSKIVRDDSITIITSSDDKEKLATSISLADSLLPYGINVFCYDYAPQESICNDLANNDADTLKSAILRNRADSISFKAQALLANATTPVERVRAVQSTLRSIKTIRQETSKQIFLGVLSQISGFQPEDLANEMAKLKPFTY